MLRDITIGQYYNSNSVIHKMDARTKILWTILYMVILFMIDGPIMYGAIIAFTAFVIKVSKIPFRFILRGIKPIVVLIAFTALLNLFMTPGENVVASLGFLKITMEGVYLAIKMVVRVILLIIGTSLLTLTTTPTVLTGGIEILLSPLKKIGVPVAVFSMMMSIALRFIPTLMDEIDKIMKAQISRGADFESGNIIARVKAMVPILIPLFISAFRRADELAVAMECRCYSCDGERTRFREYRFTKYDFYSLLAVIVLCVAMIIIKVVQ